MGFEINPKREANYRHTLTSRDYEYMKNCKVCPVVDLCGGWSVWNDARWCVGPGPWCVGGEHPDYPHGCRVICSRSSEKIEDATYALGPSNYESNLECDPENRKHCWDVEVVPDLGIVGKHKWEPWDFNWPDVGFQLNAHANYQHQDLYTISLKHLFYATRRTWSPQKDLRERFKIPESAAVAITSTVHDDILDVLAQDIPTWAAALAEYEGVTFVLAPNFSVYDNYPRLDNLFHIKRKFVALEAFQREGMKVVPDICFTTSRDFKNQVAWMRENKCEMMLMNFQVQAVTTDTPQWKAQIKSALMVQDALGWPVRMIAYGATGGKRMQDIARLYPNTTFIDSKAYRLAEFHKDLNLVVDKSIPVKDLFHMNCAQSLARIQEAKGQALKLGG